MVALTVLAILIAAPLGVGTAIYLTEYTWGGPVTRVIRFGAECLAGIPSIIFGLFGFILFVTKLKFGWSILSGGLTLAFMLLPTIIRTSEEAIKSVPPAYRTVSFSLGSTKWQTVTRVVLPSALPGHRHRDRPQRRPQHRRDGGDHLHGRQRPAPADVDLLVDTDDVRPFLHPGPGRHLHVQRLRHGGRPDHRHPRHQHPDLLPDEQVHQEVLMRGEKRET